MLNFEELVNLHYRSLYRFALSLTRQESEASDLTQQTFYVWAEKGNQLLDQSKVKTWLFTTLHRQYLQAQRRQNRFPHQQLEQVEAELPNLDSELVNRLDAVALVDLIGQLDPLFRAPVALFYLKENSYKEIAEILQVPVGTVKSRIARGIAQLQAKLMNDAASTPSCSKGPA